MRRRGGAAARTRGRPSRAGSPGGTAIALAAAAVVGSYLGVLSSRTDQIDAAARRVTGRSLGPVLDRGMAATTDLGSIYGLAGLSASLAVAGRRALATDVAVAGGIAWCAAQGAKPLLDRQRPYEADGADRLVAVPAGSSWPSGHAAVAAAMAGTLWHDAPPLLRASLVSGTTKVAASRLYVGVHHLTDVVAGVGIGVLSAAAARAVLGRRRCGHRR